MTTLASLREAMKSCLQTEGMTILQHGIQVHDYYLDILFHLKVGTPLRHDWKLPDWINDPIIASGQLPLHTMELYHVYHDCGKPFCLQIDENGRRHFPGHAERSSELWREAGGNEAIARLIAMDMDIHKIKADDLDEFCSRPEAMSLLLTGLAEIHANAAMFGGIESPSFKQKWKHIDRRGKGILARLS